METKPLEATEEALNSYAQICADYCKKARLILQEQGDMSPITEMAREVLIYARHLAQFDHTMNGAYVAARDMADCLYDHPRLKLQLWEVEDEVLDIIEAQSGHDLNIHDDLQQMMRTYRFNIQAADEGRLKDIIPIGHLNNDPIEWTQAYEDVIDEADHDAYSHLTDCPRGMGFCFVYWHEKEQALARRGIEWRSPRMMNPGVIFD